MKENSKDAAGQSQKQTKTNREKNESKSLPAKHWPILLSKIQAFVAEVAMIGIDIGDRASEVCVLSKAKQVLVRGAVPTDQATIRDVFGQLTPTTVVMETGTHSPWMDRVIQECGHRVLVASARRVSQVLKDKKKNDRRDAEQLARLAAADEKLLGIVEHRSEKAQMSLGKVKVRHQLVETRTKLCNAARGLIKSQGYRLPKAEPERVTEQLAGALPEKLAELVAPLLKQVGHLNEGIKKLDEELAEMAKKEYPQTKYVDQIYGVGPILSLAFVLAMDDASRFRRSRNVGSYMGLTPAQDQSGDSNPELRITRDGDGLIRSLLVNSAQTILRKNSPDCDLKRHGEKLAEKGGKLARKKAVVGVARKIAVLMHKLLVSKTAYNPQHNLQQSMKEQRAKEKASKAKQRAA
jgi:transposase